MSNGMEGKRWNFGVSTPKQQRTRTKGGQKTYSPKPVKTINKDRDYFRDRDPGGKSHSKDNGNSRATVTYTSSVTGICTMIEPRHDSEITYYLWSVSTRGGEKFYITRTFLNGDRVRINLSPKAAVVLESIYIEDGNDAGIAECKRLFREAPGKIEHKPKGEKFWTRITQDVCLTLLGESGRCEDLKTGTETGKDDDDFHDAVENLIVMIKNTADICPPWAKRFFDNAVSEMREMLDADDIGYVLRDGYGTTLKEGSQQ